MNRMWLYPIDRQASCFVEPARRLVCGCRSQPKAVWHRDPSASKQQRTYAFSLRIWGDEKLVENAVTGAHRHESYDASVQLRDCDRPTLV
jgi:hypothetical protein